MKVSLIMIVKNEEKSIRLLINSILDQTKVPDEIVIVDNCSEDNTVDIIKSFKNKRIKIISFSGDIGTGRNVAIKHTKNNIIVVTDGGCILNKNWCKEITKSFNDSSVDVIGGVYKPRSKNFFEYCQGFIVCKPVKKINPKTFLPSSRSLAFRKHAWQAVSGYPRHRIGGEDTGFILNLKEKGFRFVTNKKAVVYWRMRSPMKNFIKQFYFYAIGDAKTKNIFRMKKNLLFVWGSIFYLILLILAAGFYKPAFVLLLGLVFLYCFQFGIRLFLKTKNIKAFYYGSILLFWKRVAYVFGIWREWIWPYKGRYKSDNI